MKEIVPFPHSYIHYMAQYHATRDFFECHEIMEEYWKSQPGSRYEGCWLVFIRIAVACYHARRGNWAGARKMMAKSVAEIDPALMSELGVDGTELARRLHSAHVEWNAAEYPVYRDIDLPIVDPALLRECIRVCRENGWEWGMPSSEAGALIVDKHLKRDRTEVVAARARAAQLKNRSKPQ